MKSFTCPRKPYVSNFNNKMPWSTASNAFLRSKYIPKAYCFPSNIVLILSVRSIRASVVECFFLNPYAANKVLHASLWNMRDFYKWFSQIFCPDLTKANRPIVFGHMNRIFLKKAKILAIFIWLGYVVSSMDVLNIYVRGYEMLSQQHFKFFGDIISAPVLFLGFNLFNSTLISCSDVGERKNESFILWFIYFWKLFPSKLDTNFSPMVQKYSLMVSAISCLSFISLFS